MEKLWNKGQFIINPKTPGWDVGILTEDQRGGGVVKVFFELECRIIELRSTAMKVEEAEAPGSSRLFLENASVDESSLAKRDVMMTGSVIVIMLLY